MSDERPKPSDDLVKWFEEVKKELDMLNGEIEFGEKRKKLLNFSITQINPKKHSNEATLLSDLKILRFQKSIERKRIKFSIDLRDTWERQIELSGVCPQCGGTGYHNQFKHFQSGGPLNEPPETCDRCWGSGWKDGNKSPFDAITHAIMEKLD